MKEHPSRGGLAVVTHTREVGDTKYQELDVIIDKYRGQEGMVIRVLQQAQDLFGYLSMEVQSHISDRLDIPISTINGIVSFYSLFLEFAQDESCGKCIPCSIGTKRVLEILDRIVQGKGEMEDLSILEEVSAYYLCR